MVQTSNDNRRIAKNTLFLYCRMIIIMLVTLYTSRVVLKTLGIEDYGIYNVVGGIVAMFGFISGSLTSASQRYITFELGKGKTGNLSKIFSLSLELHVILSITLSLIIEPLGIWFIHNKLLIPIERLNAALWVFHLSVLSMIVMFISVPYNALIVAYEKMNAFAMVAIIEAILRLLIAYSLLVCGDFDKLIIYSILMFLVQLIIRFCYTIYCKKNIPDCSFTPIYDKKVLIEMGSFASWSIFGNIAFVTYTQGLNLLLGTFFLPIVNSARGIAVQVQSAINTFVSGFQTAINPQITKNYAAGNINEMVSLLFRSSRFSYYLLMIMTIPVVLETETVLRIWLHTIPAYTISFLRVILLTTWINSIANPLIIAVKATGRVRLYEMTVGGLMLFILPVSYVFLRFGFPPITVFIVHLFIECIAMTFRIWNCKKLIHFSLYSYFSKVIFRIFIVTISAIILPIIVQENFCRSGFLSLCVISILSILCSIVSIFLFGLTQSERSFIISKFKK